MAFLHRTTMSTILHFEISSEKAMLQYVKDISHQIKAVI